MTQRSMFDAPPAYHDDGPRRPARPHFDAEEGKQLRDEGIANAEAGAPTGWPFAALQAVRWVARTHETFTPDDVWETGLEKPPEPRALGAVMLRAVKAGYCERTETYQPSRNPLQHHTPIRIYRSLLFGFAEPINA